MPDAAPLVSLHGVSVRYETGDAWVGHGLTLELHAGETVLLLGPSGCGKSTLLLAMTGLIPTGLEADLKGRVVIDGVDTRTAAPGRLAQSVGIVFQDPDAQIVTDTLLDEVCFGLENLRVPAEKIEGRALAALQQVGLAEDREQALRSPSTLSGGGRQRLAIACALALEPALLILDEPTANLDPAASAEFYATLEQLRDPARTIVLVEHELDDAIPLADRVVILDHDGALLHDGTPAEVFGRHGRELREHGVWLPTATEIALRIGLDESEPLPIGFPELVGRVNELELPDRVLAPILHERLASSPRGDGELAVRIDGVGVELGRRRVLEDITLEVRAGEFLAIAGVNGAGKSTLTRAIAGLVPIAAGAIELGGEPLRSLDARQVGDRIGYVFQNPEQQFLTRTVRDELAYGLRVRHRPEEEIDQVVDRLLDRFDLARYADVNPFLLSHGEKRRLSVATALITEPSVLILDEPTFGQDRARAREITELICELNEDGVTILMVTHDLQLIADCADRVALLADGRLLEIGPVDQVLCHDETIQRAGLRLPPVQRFARLLADALPAWQCVYRLNRRPETAA